MENETLSPSDTGIKCMLCTALNIVLGDCRDTKQLWRM